MQRVCCTSRLRAAGVVPHRLHHPGRTAAGLYRAVPQGGDAEELLPGFESAMKTAKGAISGRLSAVGFERRRPGRARPSVRRNGAAVSSQVRSPYKGLVAESSDGGCWWPDSNRQDYAADSRDSASCRRRRMRGCGAQQCLAVGLFCLILLAEHMQYRRTNCLVSSVDTTHPTTRTSHSFIQLRNHPINMLRSGFRLLDGDDPADPFVAGERRQTIPSRQRARIGGERPVQIRWHAMHNAGCDLACRGHRTMNLATLRPADRSGTTERGSGGSPTGA